VPRDLNLNAVCRGVVSSYQYVSVGDAPRAVLCLLAAMQVSSFRTSMSIFITGRTHSFQGVCLRE
jgi:hypothetical protein